MGDFQQDPHAERFGHYLRRIRESKKLSLDAVEEMAVGYPDRLTKSHLSRIENGLAEPTFRRLYALSQIYGVPVTMLAERFEVDLLTEAVVATSSEPDDDVMACIDRLKQLGRAGRHVEALPAIDRLMRRLSDAQESVARATVHELRIMRASCLQRIERYGLAKAELEAILDEHDLSLEHRMIALYYLAAACIRTKRFTVGSMAIDRADVLVAEIGGPLRLRGEIRQLRANFEQALGRLDHAAVLFQQAIDHFVEAGCRFEHVNATRNLAAVHAEQGKYATAKRLLADVVKEAEVQHYDRQTAFALSDLGMIAWNEGQSESCESYCLRSNAIARPREFVTIVFRNCFYLWRVATEKSDPDAIRSNLRTLRAYCARIDEELPERQEFLRSVEEDA